MTEFQKKLKALNETDKKKLSVFFESVDYFYETVYLIIKNGHAIQQSELPGYGKKLETVDYYKSQIEKKLDGMGFDGKNWVADIASDYFEDYVHYREITLSIPDDVFYGNLKKVAR